MASPLEQPIQVDTANVVVEKLHEKAEKASENHVRLTDEEERMEVAKDMIMQAACSSALTGVTLKHGGPFGAAVVRNGIFISLSHNTVLMDEDPTCHAEMNAIRYACAALDTHDLSDCELFTTCEPCPMCLGACSWARIKKVYTGVDRFTAAAYGFDDKVFYDEVEAHGGQWAVSKISLGQTQPNVQPSMLNMYWGIDIERVKSILSNPQLNRTFRRRVGGKHIGFHSDGSRFGKDHRAQPGVREAAYGESSGSEDDDEEEVASNPHPNGEKYMLLLEEAIKEACATGQNKEREVFASLIVNNETGEVVSVAVNEVLRRRDATATGEVMAIRKAAKKLGTFNLQGHSMFSTLEPCVMSLGAILWARLDNLYYGLSQHAAARFGFEEGLLHYRELFADPEKVKTVVHTETRVGFEACENVFKQWSEVNGIIY